MPKAFLSSGSGDVCPLVWLPEELDPLGIFFGEAGAEAGLVDAARAGAGESFPLEERAGVDLPLVPPPLGAFSLLLALSLPPLLLLFCSLGLELRLCLLVKVDSASGYGGEFTAELISCTSSSSGDSILGLLAN